MWYNDITSIVHTKLKTNVTKELKKQYPNINFSTTSRNAQPSKFPTVYLREMGGEQRGDSITGNTLSAVMYCVKIDVVDNTSERNTAIVMEHVVDSMVKMGFQVNDLPFDMDDGIVYRKVARFRRVIADGDTL